MSCLMYAEIHTSKGVLGSTNVLITLRNHVNTLAANMQYDHMNDEKFTAKTCAMVEHEKIMLHITYERVVFSEELHNACLCLLRARR